MSFQQTHQLDFVRAELLHCHLHTCAEAVHTQRSRLRYFSPLFMSRMTAAEGGAYAPCFLSHRVQIPYALSRA